MLNVKSETFNPFLAEKLKKAWIFTKVARKIELFSIFLQPSVAFELDSIKIWLSIECK